MAIALLILVLWLYPLTTQLAIVDEENNPTQIQKRVKYSGEQLTTPILAYSAGVKNGVYTV